MSGGFDRDEHTAAWKPGPSSRHSFGEGQPAASSPEKRSLVDALIAERKAEALREALRELTDEEVLAMWRRGELRVRFGGHDHWEIPEGQECPTCKRRVPRKKKHSSPKTKVISLRVPIDDAEVFEELLEAAAKNAGLYEKGHWRFWTVHRGLIHVLQEPPDSGD